MKQLNLCNIFSSQAEFKDQAELKEINGKTCFELVKRRPK